MIDYEKIKQVLLTIDGQGKERKEEIILLNRIKELESMSEIGQEDGQEDVIDELESELESLRATVGEANDEIERLNKILDEEKSLSPIGNSIKAGMQAYTETVRPDCKCCGNQMVFNRSLLTWKCNYCGKFGYPRNER